MGTLIHTLSGCSSPAGKVLKRYSPGFIAALTLNIPDQILWQALEKQFIPYVKFFIISIFFAGIFFLSIPLLFSLGHIIERWFLRKISKHES
jgi:hypothetical protein